MAMTYTEMSNLSREDLITLYDQRAQHTRVSLDFIKQEIWRRDSEQLNRNMECLTRRIHRLTIIITILTAINVVGILVDILGK